MLENAKNAASPEDCSQRNKKAAQPINTKNSRFRKCCPNGEGLSVFRDNKTDEFCDSTNFKFEPSIISVILYDNCIEDEENEVDLQVEIGNPCNS